MKKFIKFIKECINEFLYIVGAWIKANLLVFCGVTAFFGLVITVYPITGFEDFRNICIFYIIFIVVFFNNKPSIQQDIEQDKYIDKETTNIKQNNISLISFFRNTKK